MTLEHIQLLREFLEDFTGLEPKGGFPAAVVLIDGSDRDEVMEKIASHGIASIQVSQDQSLEPVLRFMVQQIPQQKTFCLDVRSMHTGLITHLQDLVSGSFAPHLAGEETRRELSVPVGSRLLCVIEAEQYGVVHVEDLFQYACRLT